MSSVRIDFDETALLAKIAAMGEKLQDAVRPAAQAGAQVLYDEVRARVPVGTKSHGYKGAPGVYQPGNLKAAIYQVYSKTSSTNGKETYQISYNQKKAFYGRFVEFGTSRMAAQPFIRPAFTARQQDALQAVKTDFLEAARKAIDGT